FLSCGGWSRHSTVPLHLIVYSSVFFQAEDGIRDATVTGVQTCALPISSRPSASIRPAIRAPAAKRSTRRIPEWPTCHPLATRRRSEERRVGKSVAEGGRRRSEEQSRM